MKSNLIAEPKISAAALLERAKRLKLEDWPFSEACAEDVAFRAEQSFLAATDLFERLRALDRDLLPAAEERQKAEYPVVRTGAEALLAAQHSVLRFLEVNKRLKVPTILDGAEVSRACNRLKNFLAFIENAENPPVLSAKELEDRAKLEELLRAVWPS